MRQQTARLRGWEKRFIEALQGTCSQEVAAAAARVSVGTVIRRRNEDPAFDERCRALMDKQLAAQLAAERRRPMVIWTDPNARTDFTRWRVTGAIGTPSYRRVDLVVEAPSVEEALRLVERGLVADAGGPIGWISGPLIVGWEW